MKITVLGAGDAFASGCRRQSAYAVQSGGRTFLMDAGPTVLAGLKAAAIPTDTIDFVLVSHLHGDHFAGIVFLLMELLFERPRKRELVIAGPAGTENRVRDLFRAMYLEASERPLSFPLRFLHLEPDRVVELDGVSVEPFSVPHQAREPSLGLKVRHRGKTVVYSGDSGWTEEFVARTHDADLFLCECCYFDTEVYFHINYPELARNRSRIGARRLVLTHLGREVLEKLDRVEPEVAHDGMVIEL